MIGICVHDPDTFIEQPSNIRQWASEVLSSELSDAKLSEDAKVGFVMAQGALAFEESEKKAKKDLPEQMRSFMTTNGLNADAYTMKVFSEDLKQDLKILCMAAVKENGTTAKEPQAKHWWQFWE
jgi:hypothetical protein